MTHRVRLKRLRQLIIAATTKSAQCWKISNNTFSFLDETILHVLSLTYRDFCWLSNVRYTVLVMEPNSPEFCSRRSCHIAKLNSTHRQV